MGRRNRGRTAEGRRHDGMLSTVHRAHWQHLRQGRCRLKLTPVDSSHIAAIGYLEDVRVLLVRYKDGGVYARPEFPPEMWESLLAAPSKGQYLNQAWAGPRLPAILITKGGGPESDQRTGPASSGAAGPLNVIDEDADKCCRRQLTSFFGGPPSNAEHFECSACGTNFKLVMVGPSRHWRIVPLFAVHRRGK